MDSGGNAGDADGFLKEGGFLVLGLGKGDCDFGAADGDRDAGEASSGAVVEEGGNPGGESLGDGNGFDEVASGGSLRARGRQ